MPLIDKIRRAQLRPIKHLVFSGGGAKGIVYPGAYRAMKEAGVLNKVSDIAGASAGAITAAFIAVGTSIEDLRNISLTIPMDSLLGEYLHKNDKGALAYISKDGIKLYNFIKNQISKTILEADLSKLEDKTELKKVLEKSEKEQLSNKIKLLVNKIKAKDIDLTFADLHILHQFYPERFKDLVVTAVRLSDAQPQRFNYKETPNVSIALACRASASIPILVKPVEITINGKTEFYIDGGIENNLPTNLVSDPKHPEDSLVFAFGEGKKAGMYFRTDRVEHAMHRAHKSRLYKPHLLEQVGQNWAPRLFLGLNAAYLSTDKKYEDFRRIHEVYPLRTVDLHVGPISTIDFKRASKLARVMDAIGYADTMSHIIAHELGSAPHLERYYDDINQHVETIYRALLKSTGADLSKDKFLVEFKQLNDSLSKKNSGDVEAIKNNYFEKIKSYALANPTSNLAFAFTRAIEYHDGLIDEDRLLKETYLESFKTKWFARSQFSGKTFFFASSLEKSLNENPSLMPTLSKAAAEPQTNTRMSNIVHILKSLNPPHKHHEDIEMTSFSLS